MRVFIALLVLVTLYLQYVLWFERGGARDVVKLERAVAEQQAEIQSLRERNQALAAEVIDLKQGLEAIEERARSDMGMIKQGEVFFRMTDPLPGGDGDEAGDGPAHATDETP
ncbi:MAG: cell division protein FtsB [Gammaproteobacteria bacterium]